jgi:amino acid transporter
MAVSYWSKLVIVTLGVIGTLTFATYIQLGKKNVSKRNNAAVTEWIVAGIFIAFMASFVLEMLAFPRPK